MSLYRDPSLPRTRPSLVRDLLGLTATTAHHALEDQATTVLAWLIDRSPPVARSVVEVFLGRAGDIDGTIGAETQASLAKPGGGALRPDLSICVSDRALQLLVEVKVASELSIYPEFDGLQQDDVYRRLWGAPSPPEAQVRAVGTLTREPRSPHRVVDADRLVARDVSWRELRDTLHGLLAAGEVASDVALIAESFVHAIDERIAPRPPTEAELASFLADYETLLEETSSCVARLLSVTRPLIPTTARDLHDFAGRRIVLADEPDSKLYVRLYLAAAGSRLAIPGTADALVVGPERDTNGNLNRDEEPMVEAAGFTRLKDFGGYVWRRRVWPIDEDTDPDELAEEIALALRATGLIDDRGPSPRSPRGDD